MSTWLVTGATSGIGRAVTEQLLEGGAKVAAFGRHLDGIKDLMEQHDDRLWARPVDITDTAALRDVVEQAFEAFGNIDVIFSNAGSGAVGAAEELSDDAIHQQIALNMVAPIQLIRAVLPHLRKQGGGRLIQTSTMGGQITSPGGSMYHASKWGLEGFVESIIGEVAPFGIGITMIEPGSVRTQFGAALTIAEPMAEYANTPVGSVHRAIKAMGNLTGTAPRDPERVAKAIIDVADHYPAPRRLALGSDAYEAIQQALTGRLAELEEHKSITLSTDFPEGE
ncbi:short-chain dehydrogenase/reductase [Reticulibacter mediterranei]|uniref:Short-chain dehydrogenase/reductase n=1 Tax=Reticulibacter mediterranei TaxID=2778369 RepID=A0A8J3IVH7_9CHLR|nr:SDR family oxidoreductase [Reticulibacter mediterranei]GHO97590.1 short-chain dehydrogenase/reductase [Reticulibacter mediterranei]